MSYRLALVALAIMLVHCSNKESTESTENGDDSMVSHLGCTNAAEWDKCTACSDSASCKEHGCSFSNSQCLPDSGSCKSYATQSDCDAAPGCEFFQSANAECVAKCDLLSDDHERCGSQTGCAWDNQEGCVSDVQASCTSHETADACNADESCVSRNDCVRTDACLDMTTEDACVSLSHCAWIEGSEGWFCSDKCLQFDPDACGADKTCISIGYICEDATSFDCSQMTDSECESEPSCKLNVKCIRSYVTTPLCRQLSAEECATRSDCTSSGWCTSSCFSKRTKNNCESSTDVSCGWQEIHYRTGPGYRCVTSCHRVND